MSRGQVMIEDYKGYSIELEYDDTPDDPLAWMTPEERGAWFIMRHRRYNLPCEIDVDFDEYSSWTEVAEAVSEGRPYKFVRWYEHSGVAVSLRDDESGHDWDADIVGIIIGNTDDDIKTTFEEWQCYIEGHVYRLIVKTPDGDIIEDVSGVFGYNGAIAEGKQAIDAHINTSLRDRYDQYGRSHAPTARELHR